MIKKKQKKMAKKQKGLPLTWSFVKVRVLEEKKINEINKKLK